MMSYWPRCVLTDYEKRFMQKYATPDDNRRGPLRRFYPGHLELTAEQRLPTFSQNISRVSRVFGLSVAGDVNQFRVRIVDSTGEQYTADIMYLQHLVPGLAQGQPGVIGPPEANPFTPTGQDVYIINPGIMLAPNQTLTIEGYEVVPFDFEAGGQNDYRVDFTWHVWEFPGMPGSPL